MREKTNLGGGFTFAGTSLTVNRIGYGAMQLAGQDGDKRGFGARHAIFPVRSRFFARLSLRA